MDLCLIKKPRLGRGLMINPNWLKTEIISAIALKTTFSGKKILFYINYLFVEAKLIILVVN
jgi:hypothetical protein